MLTRLTYEERERLAHAEGFTNTAELFAKIADLEHALRGMVEEFGHYVEGDPSDEEEKAFNRAVNVLEGLE
jgi:hypothetical protein